MEGDSLGYETSSNSYNFIKIEIYWQSNEMKFT